jgi:hypothetical protein
MAQHAVAGLLVKHDAWLGMVWAVRRAMMAQPPSGRARAVLGRGGTLAISTVDGMSSGHVPSSYSGILPFLVYNISFAFVLQFSFAVSHNI